MQYDIGVAVAAEAALDVAAAATATIPMQYGTGTVPSHAVCTRMRCGHRFALFVLLFARLSYINDFFLEMQCPTPDPGF